MTEEKKTIQESFETFKEKIGAAIADAASLEVTTFTGDFSYKAEELIDGDDNSKFDIAKVAAKLDMKTNVDMHLVAYTKISIDADTVTIVKNNLTTEDKELVDLHKTLIASAQTARSAIVDTVKKLV